LATSAKRRIWNAKPPSESDAARFSSAFPLDYCYDSFARDDGVVTGRKRATLKRHRVTETARTLLVESGRP
jgi:hypothetical protein